VLDRTHSVWPNSDVAQHLRNRVVSNFFKVEDGIPAPKTWSRRKAGTITTVLRTLHVGQSVLLPMKQTDVSPYIRNAKRKMAEGVKFSTRKEDDTATRVWRIA
jgi:hypothetical protein